MPRAPRLTPEDRRDAIIAATVPLLIASGPDVSTRQIAAACGIAEGTLFRVFPTKQDLLEATLRASLDPTADIGQLLAVDRCLPLAERLRQVVVILVVRGQRVSGLFSALRHPGGPHHAQHRPHDRHADDRHAAGRATTDRPSPDRSGTDRHHGPPDLKERQRLVAAIAEVLAPDADRLDLDPTAAASFVRSVVSATTHPIIGDGLLTDPDLLTRLLLRALQKDSPQGTPEGLM
ncbi:helix-turn-helix domain-containing protein [Raineyella sp.]|uniref:TetR/AcrR family transcriptional regulator n=1 Tax=Raineyella sp. TaxID=1911550 RepID=UPI002B20EA86|nr:helix-turn-helix domain-containing protein [Raineyella sp.]MEA5154969.1 helix-turn-helix domain-containing protein [Raineyella sp.]